MRTLLTRPEPRLTPSPIAPARPDRWSPGHVLAAVALCATAAASVGGLLADGFYTDSLWARSAFRGNDLATLVVAVPLLAGALAASRRGSARGRLVLLGMLAYGTYDFAFYVFGATWSDWFLLHVLAFTASGLGLLFVAATLDATALARRIRGDVPRRSVALYTGAVGVALAALWTFAALRFAATGELVGSAPPEAVHVIFALDLSLMAPALVLSAVLLWRRSGWGLAAAVATNVAASVYQVALMLGAQFQHDAGVPDTTWFSPSSLAVLAGSAVAAVALLRHVDDGPAR